MTFTSTRKIIIQNISKYNQKSNSCRRGTDLDLLGDARAPEVLVAAVALILENDHVVEETNIEEVIETEIEVTATEIVDQEAP